MVVMVGSAHADDDATRLAERYEASDALPAPVLEIDPVFRPTVEGLATKEVHHTARYDLFGTRITLDGVERLDETDVASRGWRTELKLRRDLGFAMLTAGLSLENIQSTNIVRTAEQGEQRFGSRTYVDMGVALTRTFKLSRWHTAWISLSLGRRRWLGDGPPPPGEQDSTQVMLSIGTTFK